MELPQIVSLGAPAKLYETSNPIQAWPYREGHQSFGRFQLRRRIRSGPDDECYVASLAGVAGFEKVVFLRRFDPARLGDIELWKAQARIHKRGIAQLFELGCDADWGFMCGEYVHGAALRDLPRIPWLVALAIAHDACATMFHAREVDPAITPARIRLSLSGDVVLCMGPPARQRSWHELLCSVLHPVLATAATPEERVLLNELFADDSPDAVWVVSDALVERHPELDPVLPVVFLSLAGRLDRVTAHRLLVERVPIEQLRALWQVVVDATRSSG